jgi:hypothetical protein
MLPEVRDVDGKRMSKINAMVGRDPEMVWIQWSGAIFWSGIAPAILARVEWISMRNSPLLSEKGMFFRIPETGVPDR